MQILVRLCNVTAVYGLPQIWCTIAPLSCNRAWVSMEAALCQTAKQMRFRATRIPHAVTVMVLDLDFYTKNPDGVGGAVNILLFSDLTAAVGSEAALVARCWGAILGVG